jgi:hypothetical protein
MTELKRCPFCYGIGRVHSPGRNGDPDDDGMPCPKCHGNGAVEVDVGQSEDGK